MWQHYLQVIIVTDVLFNLFFHLLQLKTFLCCRNDLGGISRRFCSLEYRLNNLDYKTTNIQRICSLRAQQQIFRGNPIIDDTDSEEEKIDEGVEL